MGRKRGRKRRRLALVGVAAASLGGLWTYARSANSRYEHLDLEDVEKPGQWLKVDGVRLHCVESGEGPVLVLIHGLGAYTFSFRKVIPELARRFRVIALDLKGFGYSERPPHGDYSLTEQARLVWKALGQLGVSRGAVLGHSMGGAVAMRLALAHPEMVERLVLAASASDHDLGRFSWGAALAGRLLPLLAPFTYYNRRFREFSIRSGYHDPSRCTDDVIEGYMKPGRIRGYLRSLGNTMASWRKDPPLHPWQITQPTLILWGASDRWLPPSRGQRLQRLIPNSRLVVVREAGHLLFDEQPEACVGAIEEFLGVRLEAEASAGGSRA